MCSHSVPHPLVSAGRARRETSLMARNTPPSSQVLAPSVLGLGSWGRGTLFVGACRPAWPLDPILQSVYPSPRPVDLQSSFVRPFSSISLCTRIDRAWRKPPPFSVGPHRLPTQGGVDSLEIGVRGHVGAGASSQMPGLRTLTRSQAGLPGTAVLLWAQPAPPSQRLGWG